MTAPIRPRRSVLYMPGSNPRALEKARSLPADGLIFDLEDAVAPADKITAREAVSALVTAQKSNRGAAPYSRWVNRPLGRHLAGTQRSGLRQIQEHRSKHIVLVVQRHAADQVRGDTALRARLQAPSRPARTDARRSAATARDGCR